MNKTPNIHVIMPVFNCEKFVESAVYSVLSQPYENIDIIIIDDGSTDRSGFICDKLEKKEARVHVIHKENAGVSSARNTGIDYVLNNCDVHNDYIAFCDADDLWAKDCISSNFADLLDKDIICLKSCFMSEDSTLCSCPPEPQDFGKIVKGGTANIWRYTYHFGAFLYQIDLFRKYNIRFDTELKYNEDKIIFMQLIYLCSYIREIPIMMYLYRKNHTSAMHTRKYGLDYYIPLINGWIRSDKLMSSFKNDARGELEAGHVLACIYVIDMAKEHFGRFRKKKILLETIRSHEIYPTYLNLDKNGVSCAQWKDYNLLNNHINLFVIKNRFIGVLVFFFKLLRQTKIVSKFLYKRTFTSPNKFI